jgi:hypothetical protein
MDLKPMPKVIFYDGYIPNQPSNVKACIDTINHIIYVSRKHLMTMNARDIRNIVIHELSNYNVKGHGYDFERVNIDTRAGTWKPQTGHGIINIDGGSRRKKDDLIKLKWTSEQFEKYTNYYRIAKRRLQRGIKPPHGDEPEGYSEWLKETWEYRKNIRPKNEKNPLVRVCRSCDKKYGGTKCPYCGH